MKCLDIQMSIVKRQSLMKHIYHKLCSKLFTVCAKIELLSERNHDSIILKNKNIQFLGCRKLHYVTKIKS